MLQDIAPHTYSNVFAPKPPQADSPVFCFDRAGGLILRPAEQIELPTAAELDAVRYAFDLDGTAYFLAREPFDPPPDGRYRKAGELRQAQPPHLRFACAVAASLWRWYQGNRFCGGCGTPMDESRTERALVCPACGRTVYPKICPAVIVAVTDGERLLLTRYAGRSFRAYALVAGFNEIGESIEQTVHREVLEETGVRVKNLRFYKSQPWVLTDSLLMGFFADLDGPDRITLQTQELSEGLWVPRHLVPPRPGDISLTAEMMELFRTGRNP